jgi:hypothetical protein
MIYSVHQPQYLPWLGFFDKIDKSDAFVFLDDVQYKHREYQNRNKVRTKDGWIWLTVPIKFYRGDKISDVRIDDSRDWKTQHLKSLKSWYSRGDNFDKYFSFFEALYKKEWDKLCELNVGIIEFLLDSLGIKKPIYFESELNAGGEKTQRIINIGEKLKADVYLSGAGGRDYLEENKFSESGMGLCYQDFVHPAYRQQFSNKREDFIPYMSVVDLMFNEGERSLGIIRGGKNNV